MIFFVSHSQDISLSHINIGQYKGVIYQPKHRKFMMSRISSLNLLSPEVRALLLRWSEALPLT